MKKGDIVLIPFPFTDLLGNKIGPAVILIESEYFVTVCFISTQIKYYSDFDFLLYPNESNHLKRESLIRLDKMASIDKELIIGRIGTLNDVEVKTLNVNLKGILKL
jgi:mRNA interferase MazF